MKIKEGFILRQVADSFIVVAVGKAVKNFKGIINLNETGALLWSELEKGADEQALVQTLLNEYEGVTEEVAKIDVSAFVAKLMEAGLLD